jgi:hypothetical protein
MLNTVLAIKDRNRILNPLYPYFVYGNISVIRLTLYVYHVHHKNPQNSSPRRQKNQLVFPGASILIKTEPVGKIYTKPAALSICLGTGTE